VPKIVGGTGTRGERYGPTHGGRKGTDGFEKAGGREEPDMNNRTKHQKVPLLDERRWSINIGVGLQDISM
jgi:hypothetical protein